MLLKSEIPINNNLIIKIMGGGSGKQVEEEKQIKAGNKIFLDEGVGIESS